MTAEQPTIDIIIVNWNTRQQLQECLSSLSCTRRNGYVVGRVVVVDNGSTDHSADNLSFSNLPLRVIRNDNNRGFSAACNQGVSGSEADYFLFLNPDARLLDDTLEKSVECMSMPEHSHIGILGVQLLCDNGEVARSCARFPTTWSFVSKMTGLNRLFPRTFPDHFYLEWDHLQSCPIEQVMGAYFFVRKSVFDATNGFDERFFVYFEEVDLCLRALQAGWSTYYLATAQCYHSGGGSSGQITAVRLFYSLRSRILYGFKNFKMDSAVALFLSTLLIEPISRVCQAILSGSAARVKGVLHAYLLLWRALPEILGNSHLRKSGSLNLDLETPR